MLPITAKAVQDAIALATAARSFDPEKDVTLLTLMEGRTQESMMRALLALARLTAIALPEDQMMVLAAQYGAVDRHQPVLL